MSEPSISIVEQESTTGGWGCETDLDTSPQEVLVRAAATCYGATLAGLLRRSGLPARKIRISARGRFERRSGAPHLTSVALHASIAGVEGVRFPEYESAAHVARDRSLLRRALADEVSYDLDPIHLHEEEALPPISTNPRVALAASPAR